VYSDDIKRFMWPEIHRYQKKDRAIADPAVNTLYGSSKRAFRYSSAGKDFKPPREHSNFVKKRVGAI